METMVSLGVLLAVVGLILKELLPWIIKRQNGSKSDHDLLVETHQMLAQWLDKEDDDGIRTRDILHSLDKAIERLAGSADAQSEALRDISRTQQETVRLLERLNAGNK